MYEVFSLVPSKNLSQIGPKQQFCQIAMCQQMAFWYNCKFYHSKIDKLTLSLFQFSLASGFSEGTRENILHIFRAYLENETNKNLKNLLKIN